MRFYLWLISVINFLFTAQCIESKKIKCFKGNNPIRKVAQWTNVTKDKLERDLTPSEEQTLPIHGITKQINPWYSNNKRPIGLFVIGPPAVCKTSAMDFVKQNVNTFGIKLQSQDTLYLDAVIIDGDDWRKANLDAMTLRTDLGPSDICCEDYDVIVGEKEKEWKEKTLKTALKNKQNIIYPDTLLDYHSFLQIFNQFITNDYCIKLIFIVGDRNDVIARGKAAEKSDHRMYKKYQYGVSMDCMQKLFTEFLSYPELYSQIKIVSTAAPIHLAKELSFREFDDKVTADLSHWTVFTEFESMREKKLGDQWQKQEQASKWNHKLIAQNQIPRSYIGIFICIGISILLLILVAILVYLVVADRKS